jgi:putative tricarboxylic transport membrane protein
VNETGARRVDTVGIAVAVLLFILAAVIFWDMSRLELSSIYGLGPKAMPIVVASGLALLAIGNVVMALAGDFPERDDADPKAILLILGGVVALIVLIGVGGGFIPATAILFVATAAAFGRRALVTDLVIGLVLALVVYLIFAKLLALSLPMGPIERLM